LGQQGSSGSLTKLVSGGALMIMNVNTLVYYLYSLNFKIVMSKDCRQVVVSKEFYMTVGIPAMG